MYNVTEGLGICIMVTERLGICIMVTEGLGICITRLREGCKANALIIGPCIHSARYNADKMQPGKCFLKLETCC